MYQFANVPSTGLVASGAVCFYKFMPIERLTLLFCPIGGIPASPTAVGLIKIQNRSGTA